ncbi:MAG: T9SS type A sorting domain-containing protein [Brumimicrobium sp.]
MKKIYFLALALFVGGGIYGQDNPSFENWTGSTPDNLENWEFVQGFTSNDLMGVGDVEDENGDPVVPIVEMTDVPTDGNSYARMTSFELSNSTQPQMIPDGPYGTVNSQTFASTDKFESFSVDVKYDIIGTDEALIFIQANDANGDPVGQGIVQLDGSEANFTTEEVVMNYFTFEPIVEYEFILSSSIKQILADLGGNPTPDIEPGSVLDVDNIVTGNTITDAPVVSNVVADDISDNGDGSDLEVTFDVPGDEADIANYYVVAFESGFNPAALQDPLQFFSGAGIQATPNGSSHTINFQAGDDYYVLNQAQTSLDPSPIVEDEEMVVWVYVEGQNGANDVWVSSNDVTLTSSSASLNSEKIKGTKLYPNPASDFVNFNFNGAEVERVEISNLNGQVVKEFVPNNNTTKVDVSSLENGVYIYRALDNESKVSYTNKVVISK